MVLQRLIIATGLGGARPGAAPAAVADGAAADLTQLENLEPAAVVKTAWFDFRAIADWVARAEYPLLVFVLGFAATAVCGLILLWLLNRLTAPRPGRRQSFRRRLVRTLAPPAILALALLGVFSFFLPVLKTMPADWLSPGIKLFLTVLTLVAAWGGFRLLELLALALNNYARKSTNSLDNLLVDIVRKTTKITLGIITGLFIGQSIFGINITALLAGAGVMGLAVAFAARDTLANFFGTVVIIADQPFRVGDWVRIGSVSGLVVSVGMRSTRLRTAEETECTIPNSLVASQTVENLSRAGRIKHCFELTMTYDQTPEQLSRAIELLHRITDNYRGADLPDFQPQVFFSGFGNWSLNLKVIMWLKTGDFKTAEQLKSALNLEILREFNAAGLQMAFPTTTNVLVEAGTGTVTKPAARNRT